MTSSFLTTTCVNIVLFFGILASCGDGVRLSVREAMDIQHVQQNGTIDRFQKRSDLDELIGKDRVADVGTTLGNVKLTIYDVWCSDLDGPTWFPNDPYVRFRMGSHEGRTNTVSKSGNDPKFEGRIEFLLSQSELREALIVKVKQAKVNLYGHLGNASISLTEAWHCQKLKYDGPLLNAKGGMLHFKYKIDSPICRYPESLLDQQIVGLWHYLEAGLLEITRAKHDEEHSTLQLSMDGGPAVELRPLGEWFVAVHRVKDDAGSKLHWRVKPSGTPGVIAMDVWLEGENTWEGEFIGNAEDCMEFWLYNACLNRFSKMLGPRVVPHNSYPVARAPMKESLAEHTKKYLTFLGDLATQENHHQSAAELLGNMEKNGHGHEASEVAKQTALTLLADLARRENIKNRLARIREMRSGMMLLIRSTLLHLCSAGSETEVFNSWAGKDSTEMMPGEEITIREKLRKVLQKAINEGPESYDESWMNGLQLKWWLTACREFRTSWELRCDDRF